MHSEDKADEIRTLLASCITQALLEERYSIMDYSDCYYEGDTPGLDEKKVKGIIQDVLKDAGY